MNGAAAAADNRELEDLFDSIAVAPAQAPEPASNEPAAVDACAAEHDESTSAGTCEKMLNSVGQLTRKLHDTLAELGYDKQIQEVAAATLPDARQRLSYVVSLTEQAASRSLHAVEQASPVQETLARGAKSLADQWDRAFDGKMDVDAFKALAESTRDYLRGVPARTDMTRAHLQEIVMAQEFQDLTGQVLKRITVLANDLESQLLKLLVENAPVSARKTEALSLLNGPAIGGGADVVSNQRQVDELLESLGF